MQKQIFAAAAGLLFTGSAQAFDVAAGVRLSTLGPGLELATGINDFVTVRGVLNGFSVSGNFTDDEDNEYKGKLKLFTTGALVDVHPFKGVFRLTAGGLINGFAVTGRTRDEQQFSFETDDFVYDGQGTADAKIDFPSFAPYLGLGWGRPIKSDGRFWMSFDVGIMLQGSLNADLNLRGTGTVTEKDNPANTRAVNFENDAAVRADLDNYERSLEDEAKDFKYYPVIGIGLGYRF